MAEPERPSGIWFAIDVGKVRVGVARSDPRGVLAVPVCTLKRDVKRQTDVDELVALLGEYEAVGVVVGLPKNLRGEESFAVTEARNYGEIVAARIAPLPLLYVDERMTTVMAARNLADSGIRARDQRSRIDQAAAVAILQSFLDSER